MKTGTVLLHSSGPHPDATQTFLCSNPTQILTLYADKWSLQKEGSKKEGFHNNPWDSLKAHLHFSNKIDNLPEWVGYLTYEMGAFSDQILPFYPPSIPLAQFFNYENVQVMEKEMAPPIISHLSTPSHSDSYIATIKDIQEEIRRGQVYQVNLSHEMNIPFSEDPYELFLKLTKNSPAPFAAYLKSDSFSLLSASPERLLRKKGSRLETRPIKGTAPRGKTEEEDEKLAKNLLQSEKDRAELLMITDLMRNDLAKISLSGTVKVDELFQLETYSNVFHLVSAIHSLAKPDLHPIELLRAVFPGGSISGCPKQSAQESIYRHERRPRGIYTGSIGYFTSQGDFDFNIAIRTLLHQNNTLSWGLGGAIVADSIPEKEYQETLHKGASISLSLTSLDCCNKAVLDFNLQNISVFN